MTLRIYRYWERKRNPVSKIFLNFSIYIEAVCLSLAIGSLFFAYSTLLLNWTLVAEYFFISLACGWLGYLVTYIKFPKVSPWWGFGTISSLGFGATIFTIFMPYNPYLEKSGFINWGGIRLPADILAVVMLISAFLPTCIVLFQIFKKTEDRELKLRSLGLGAVFISGLMVGFIDYLLEAVFDFAPSASSDIAMIFIGISVILIAIFTQRRPSLFKSNLESTGLGLPLNL